MTAVRRFGLWSVLLCTAVIVTVAVSRSSSSGTTQPVRTDEPGLPAAAAPGSLRQDSPPVRRTVEVTARRYQFTPARIEVRENDLVKVVFSTEDIPHSFTIDEYRIAKRAAPNRPVTFEFLANQVGTFVLYCNLTTEEGCRKMRGQLVVRPQ